MNQIAAYGGFPQRYPHWRFGMEYERLRKQHHYGLGRIYEMVINNDPCYAYLQESNPLVDQKLVIAHVYGHCDFFKNNLWFAATNRKMMDEMANHSTHVREAHREARRGRPSSGGSTLLPEPRAFDRPAQHVTSSGGPLDEAAAPVPREDPIEKYRAKDYMDRYINPPTRLAAEAKKRGEDRAKLRHATPVRPTRDVLQYLIDHARLEDWQADCLSIVREESYYYAPQGMTKVMNEGWACLSADSLAFTDRGLMTMRGVVEAGGELTIHDGEQPRRVYDRNIIPDHETVTLRTRRGLAGVRVEQPPRHAGRWDMVPAGRVGRRLAGSHQRRGRAVADQAGVPRLVPACAPGPQAAAGRCVGGGHGRPVRGGFGRLHAGPGDDRRPVPWARQARRPDAAPTTNRCESRASWTGNWRRLSATSSAMEPSPGRPARSRFGPATRPERRSSNCWPTNCSAFRAPSTQTRRWGTPCRSVRRRWSISCRPPSPSRLAAVACRPPF